MTCFAFHVLSRLPLGTAKRRQRRVCHTLLGAVGVPTIKPLGVIVFVLGILGGVLGLLALGNGLLAACTLELILELLDFGGVLDAGLVRLKQCTNKRNAQPQCMMRY